MGVAPETLLLTEIGYQIVSTLENSTVKVWNGKEFIKATVKRSDQEEILSKILFSNGESIYCNSKQSFLVKITGNSYKMEAEYLKPKLIVPECNYPVIRQGLDSDLGSNDLTLIPSNKSLRRKVEWINNLLKQKGSLNGNKLRIEDFDYNFLTRLRLLFNTLGFCAIIKGSYIYVLEKYFTKLDNVGIEYKSLPESTDDSIYPYQHVAQVTITNRQAYVYTLEGPDTAVFNGMMLSLKN